MPPGAKFGGRVKGTPNRATATIQETLARLDCDPFEGMATIAINQLPCGVCRGKGRTPYKLADGQHADGCDAKPNSQGLCKCEGIGERTCLSCYGTLIEGCSPELRGKMFAELGNYIGSKRKALEVSGELGVYTTVEKNLMAARQRAMEEENGKTQS